MRLLGFVFLFSFFFTACNTDLIPNYVLKTDRPIIIKFSNPEPEINEEFSAKLLIGGQNFKQDSDLTINWLGIKSLKYKTPLKFSISESMLKQMAEKNPKMNDVYKKYKDNGVVNIPFFASFKVDNRNITITKYLKLHKKTDKNTPKNPEILKVILFFEKEGEIKKKTVRNKETILFSSLKDMPDFLGFQAVAKNPEETNNDELIYRWFFTPDKDDKIDDYFEVDTSQEKIKRFFGTDLASQRHKNMLLTLKSVKKQLKEKKDIKNLEFSFYLLAKDHAQNPKNAEEYRFGVDYFIFNLKFGE